MVQAAIDRSDMGEMLTSHIRGAFTSKIAPLVPEALPIALDLGRWTSESMFRNHYCAPVIGTWPPVPAADRTNGQQILRHGFTPYPPPGVSSEEYIQNPDLWIRTQFKDRHNKKDVIVSLDGGVYAAKSGATFVHLELMSEISASRRRAPQTALPRGNVNASISRGFSQSVLGIGPHR